MRPTQTTAIATAILLLSATACHGGHLEGPKVELRERRLNDRQPPLEVMDAIGVRPGMVIGEIGAGRGRMTVWLAWRVGDEGRIIANDIDDGALQHLDDRCREQGITNIETVLGDVTDPHLPESALDMAFMINVFHHLDEAQPLLRRLVPSLKPGGVLAIVECSPDKTDWGAGHGCASPAEVETQLAAAGFELTRTDDRLDEDTIYLARLKGPSAPTPPSR